jgi:macrolide transport system ATP-binding/permease protein
MDLRYAFRTLANTPGFTALAVATLALGIGINTVVFTIYGSVAFRQLAVRAPEEIVRLGWKSAGFPSGQFAWGEYERLATSAHSFASVIATSNPQTIVCKLPDSIPAGTQVVRMRLVSTNYFEALGITPRVGRSFGGSDRAVAIVSHDFWTKKLGADPEIYGKKLSTQGVDLSIVGVAPDKFAGTGVPPQAPDFWIPASAQALVMPGVDWMHSEGAREWQVLARRRPDVTAGQYSAELTVLSRAWPLEAGKPIQLSATRATFFQTDGGAFEGFVAVCTILMVAVGLVLLIGCVNLTNLIAARNSGRGHEVAVRLALGASRWRLVRQFCAESLVLGVLGGAAGLFLSAWTCAWLGTKAIELLQEIANGAVGVSLDLSPDWRVFAWTAALSVMVGIAVGILPALRASSGDVNSTLKQGMAGGFGGVGSRRSRNLLLTAQVASCLVLLAAAGLLFRGASRSARVIAGFDLKHLAIVGVDTRAMAGSALARLEVQRQAIARMQAIPEIVSVAWADRSPFLGTGSGIFRNEQGAALGCIFNGVSDEYFATLGIPLLTGRTFTQQELEQQPPIAVINESTARRLWPGQNALGRRIAPATNWLRDVAGHESFTVVGVVKTVRSTFLSKEDEGYVYIPRRLHDSGASFLVRTRGMPDKSFKSLLEALASVNTNLPGRTYVVSMEQGPVRIQELMARAPAIAASVLGGLSLTLACLGIYGVVSHLVSQRTREIGIRMALGAARWDIIEVVGSQTFRPVAWGAGVGLLGAFGVSGLLHALIVMPDSPDLTYGAGAFDPVTFLGVLSILGAVLVVAAFVPMRRAMLVEPALALRNE